VSRKIVLSSDDFWLVRLVVLLRSAKEDVTERSIVMEFERRNIIGVTTPMIRRLLRSFVKKGYIREVESQAGLFAATALGRRVASEAHTKLSKLLGAVL
jgi:hypothetical protein